MSTEAPSPLTSRILETRPVVWQSMQFIQQEDFKDLSVEAMGKLKTSILENQFTAPFYAWEDGEGVTYCLDGKHRTLALEALANEGHAIPEELPATFIRCENKKEAAKLVLQYSSIYARISQQGLFDFIGMYDLEYDQIKSQVDIPEFSTERFEQKFDVFGTKDAEDDEVLPAEHDVFVKPGDLFEINGHRVICGSFRDEETVSLLMDGKKARIVTCDPPYNLPVNFFSNKDHDRHKDFAMGAGEMSDEEFVEFLMLIMQRSVDNTVAGGIHYIFMDFRHVWHMTEAGRRIYGTTQPKQLCVWTKDNFANGSFYRAQHELCFVFSNEAAKAQWNKDILDEGGFYKNDNQLVFIYKNGDGAKHLSHLELKDRIRTNVWKYPSATSTANPDRKEVYNHPTPKPVAMIADSILDTTNEGDIVIDWFLGSGTALIGAAQTGRYCYATEIEPLFVQGDIMRYLVWAKRNDVTVDFQHLNGELTEADFQAALPAEK